jgi:hypothetical protein
VDCTQILLPNGRGVRYRILKASECDKILTAAGQRLTNESTALDLRNAEGVIGAEAMVVQVTVKSGYERKLVTEAKVENGKVVAEAVWSDPLAALTPSDWRKWEPPPDGKDTLDEMFGPKGSRILSEIYHREHSISQSEVNTILGKGTTVVL